MTYSFVLLDIRRTGLLIGLGSGERLQIRDHCLGVNELLDMLDLKGPVVIGDDGCDDNRFVGEIFPGFGLRRVGELWGRYHVKQIRSQSQNLGYRRE
jgi:hypothetical protein